MSKYTTEVRYICESKAGLRESKGLSNVDSILTTSAPLIFNFDFPIYDEQYRLVFEKMILRHFYVREIAFETVGLWQLKLWDKLNLIMPYYNQLYLSALLEFNPLYDVDYTVLHMGQTSGSTSESENISEDKDRSGSRNVSENDTTSNTQWNLFSDTPQGGINGITADNDSVADNTYLTDARKISDSGSVAKQIAETDSASEDTAIARQKAGSVTNMDSYTDKVSGKRGGLTYAKMLKEFRETFLKIDEMVCKELEPLFFGLW